MVQGSPPRMRGKAVGSAMTFGGGGITPAYAGKRSPVHRRYWHSRDHPRVCGEKLHMRSIPCWYVGSPPRVRGKDVFPDSLPCAVRITPACAGKRGRCCPDRLRCWDHPRVCGEKDQPITRAEHEEGSPPRVRGKAKAGVVDNLHLRITPACAGKSKRTDCR